MVSTTAIIEIMNHSRLFLLDNIVGVGPARMRRLMQIVALLRGAIAEFACVLCWIAQLVEAMLPSRFPYFRDNCTARKVFLGRIQELIPSLRVQDFVRPPSSRTSQ